MRYKKTLFENIKSIYKDSKWLFAICIAFCLFSVPNFNSTIGKGLDPSWGDFLNYASKLGVIFGKNSYFTYGPLGFLECPKNVGYNLLIANLFWGIVYAINVYAIFDIAKHIRLSQYNMLSATIAAVIFPIANVSGSLYLCYVIFLTLVMIHNGERRYFILYNILMTCLFFIKFSSYFTGLVALIVYSFFYVVGEKKIKRAILLCLCIPMSGIAYLVYNPSLHSLINYMRGALEISVGYNSAMSSSGEGPDESVFWVAIGVILCIILLIEIGRNAKLYLPIYAALISSLLFYYKEGFVRHGGWACFQGVAAIFSIILISFDIEEILSCLKTKFHKKVVTGCIVTIVAICICYAGDIVGTALESLNTRIFDYPINLIKAIDDDGDGAAQLSDSFKEIIGEDTVCAFPWELSYGIDDEINFICMPVAQNYTSYTVWCDSVNAEFFYDTTAAPTYILFTFDKIDDRFPLIETPRTWHAIKDCYECLLEENGTYLLKRKETIEQAEYSGELIREDTVTKKMTVQCIDEEDEYTIEIPSNAKYFTVSADLGFGGNIKKLLWKIPEVNMEFLCDDGSVVSGRVLLNMMDTMINIDEVGRYDDYTSVSEEESKRAFIKLKFTGDGASYYKSIKITWYSVDYDKLSVGTLEDRFEGYQEDTEADVQMNLISTESTETECRIIWGWIYADWEYAQNFYVLSGDKLYPITRFAWDEVTTYLNLSEEKNLGIRCRFPINNDISFIVYDDEEKVYCQKKIDVEQLVTNE